MSQDLEVGMMVKLVLIILDTGTGRKVCAQLWKEFQIIVWWMDPKPHAFTCVQVGPRNHRKHLLNTEL